MHFAEALDLCAYGVVVPTTSRPRHNGVHPRLSAPKDATSSAISKLKTPAVAKASHTMQSCIIAAAFDMDAVAMPNTSAEEKHGDARPRYKSEFPHPKDPVFENPEIGEMAAQFKDIMMKRLKDHPMGVRLAKVCIDPKVYDFFNKTENSKFKIEGNTTTLTWAGRRTPDFMLRQLEKVYPHIFGITGSTHKKASITLRDLEKIKAAVKQVEENGHTFTSHSGPSAFYPSKLEQNDNALSGNFVSLTINNGNHLQQTVNPPVPTLPHFISAGYVPLGLDHDSLSSNFKHAKKSWLGSMWRDFKGVEKDPLLPLTQIPRGDKTPLLNVASKTAAGDNQGGCEDCNKSSILLDYAVVDEVDLSWKVVLAATIASLLLALLGCVVAVAFPKF